MTLQKPVTRSRPKVMCPGSAPSPLRWSVFTFPFIVQIINSYRKCAPTTTTTATHLTSPLDEDECRGETEAWGIQGHMTGLLPQEEGPICCLECVYTAALVNWPQIRSWKTIWCNFCPVSFISQYSCKSPQILKPHLKTCSHTQMYTDTLSYTFQLASVMIPVKRAFVVWLIMVQDKRSSSKRIN